MNYHPSSTRYDSMQFRRSGRSGLKLPALSLGLWHNFGDVDEFSTAREIVCSAFDSGITHFDLANNYGPPPGSAETTLGRILKADLSAWRDELILSTKAGYLMWPGPYGEWGSRKNLLASLDQSLLRMGLDYVDIFYSHRPDPDTPLEETMGALAHAVRSGKALYAGISSYNADQTARATSILRDLGTPCVIHQVRYNILSQGAENTLFPILDETGTGCIVFCPLAQGILTSRYLTGEIAEDSRAAKPHGFLKTTAVQENLEKAKQLYKMAEQRGQTLAQMALSWTLRLPSVTSSLIGVSSTAQLAENLRCLENTAFSEKECEAIKKIING